MKNVKKRILPIIPFTALNQTTKRNLRSYFATTQEVVVENKERFQFSASHWLLGLKTHSDWVSVPLRRHQFETQCKTFSFTADEIEEFFEQEAIRLDFYNIN